MRGPEQFNQKGRAVADQAPPKTGFEKWQDDIDKAAGADSKVYEITVKAGDSVDKIAKSQGSTIDTLKKLNPTAAVLRSGQVLKCQKASIRRVITSWRHISATSIAQRYNGGGDPNYAKKLDYALMLVRKGEAALCAQ
jgi:hypothetical protein